jgi:NTE family protein
MVSGAGVALALSGGAARTLAHVGVLKLLEREGVPIAGLAGTSGGALVAVLVAAGYPLRDLERDALAIGWRRIVEFRPTPLGIMTTERLGEFVRRAIGDLRFEDLRLPCAVVAADLTAQAKRVFRSGPVAEAVEASCAIPEFFRPVELNGHVYTDGGVVEPLPVDTLIELMVDHPCPVVAVNVLQRTRHRSPPRHIWQLVGRISALVQYQLVSQEAQRAEVFVEPEVANFPFFDLENAAGLIAAGERAMEKSLSRLLDVLYRWEQDGEGPPGPSLPADGPLRKD